MNPLTPDGNLTLVDDEGKHPSIGKQFITVVTKTGNYFYLIIDRDDEGKETVHFLNQVDEADLFALMDEETAKEFQKPTVPPVEEPEPVETEPEPVPEEKETTTNVMPVIVLVLALAGGGVFGFLKLKEKQKGTEQAKPDPDADYEDEEDWGEEFPEVDESEDAEQDEDVDELME